MFGLDEWIADLANGEALAVVLAVALLLGLRHASDPDHLAAVSTLIASEPEDGTRRAGRLGLAWGLGHAATLALFGLPIVLFHAYLPDAVQRAAEALVGLMIMFLAVRLLTALASRSLPRARPPSRRRRASPPAPARRACSHTSMHTSPRAGSAGRRVQAFGIGLVHGMGGSAGVGVLLLATIPAQAEAVASAARARSGHRRLDGGGLVGVRLRNHARSGAQADARVRARHGGPHPRLRRLVRPRSGRRGPVPAVNARATPDAETVLAERVFAGGRSKPFA